MKVQTNAVEHGHQTRIDTETLVSNLPRVWNPDYNNLLTEFSDKSLFRYEENNEATPVSLVSEGFLTDFGTMGGFSDSTEPETCPRAALAGSTVPSPLQIRPQVALRGRIAGAPTSQITTTPTTTTTETTRLPTFHSSLG